MFQVEQLVNPAVLSDSSRYAAEFFPRAPFRNVVIDNFFKPEFCAALVAEFPNFDERAAVNENGEVGSKAVQEKVARLGPNYRQLDKLAKSKQFRALIGKITGIADLQYDPYYFGGGTHENRQGQDLDAHVDFNFHPITKQHRRLNLIVYFNEHWEQGWGGCLDLHRDPYLEPAKDQIKTVKPLMNRCVIFETTESSWHGFTRINLPVEQRDLSRKSFALYYYTDSRPAEETGKPHSTIYVERHLPERFADGYQLKTEDAQQLRLLLARRDQHLRRLYNNVTELGWQLEQAQARMPVQSAVATQPAQTLDADPSTALQQLQDANQALEAQLLMLRNSSSWRVTAPLRRLRYEAGRIKRRLLG